MVRIDVKKRKKRIFNKERIKIRRDAVLTSAVLILGYITRNASASYGWIVVSAPLLGFACFSCFISRPLLPYYTPSYNFVLSDNKPLQNYKTLFK
jgi:hypothetical protein